MSGILIPALQKARIARITNFSINLSSFHLYRAAQEGIEIFNVASIKETYGSAINVTWHLPGAGDDCFFRDACDDP